MIQSINHVCFSVSDLKRSIYFYQNVLGGRLLTEGRTTAYLDIGGLWIALTQQGDIPRGQLALSKTHMAFSIDESDLDGWYEKLTANDVNILEGRPRDARDKQSIYFTDPDGHKLEVHTGTLQDRLDYYKESKSHMKFYWNGRI